MQTTAHSKGALLAHPLYNLAQLHYTNTEPRIDEIIQAFLTIGQGIAPRWIEMPKGVIFLQLQPNDPASGAIYVYDRKKGQFYLLEFEGCDEHLTVEDFSFLFAEYDLLRLAEQPSLLQSLCQTPASA